MSDINTVKGTEFSKLDDYLDKIDQVAFDITYDNIQTFNRSFDGSTHIYILSSSSKDDDGRSVFEGLPLIKIIQDPSTEQYKFMIDTSEASNECDEWNSPDGSFTIRLCNITRRMILTRHNKTLLFWMIVQDYDAAYGSFVKILISIGINDVFVTQTI